jgi:hypothetical protein
MKFKDFENMINFEEFIISDVAVPYAACLIKGIAKEGKKLAKRSVLPVIADDCKDVLQALYNKNEKELFKSKVATKKELTKAIKLHLPLNEELFARAVLERFSEGQLIRAGVFALEVLHQFYNTKQATFNNYAWLGIKSA